MNRPSPAQAGVFDDHLEQWRSYRQQPWAKIRYAVVASVLDRHLEPMVGPLRILDVAGGDGADSIRLAELGHNVTIVDFSAAMLAAAQESAEQAGVQSRLTTFEARFDDLVELGLADFDAVLCHFVIQYVDDVAGAVAAAAAAARTGGLVSLIAPNPASSVLSAAIRDLDFDEAEQLISSSTRRAATFDQPVAAIEPTTGQDYLRDAGCEVVGRYGARALIDFIADDAAKRTPETYAALERLELALCDRSPYRDIAALWHLVAVRR